MTLINISKVNRTSFLFRNAHIKHGRARMFRQSYGILVVLLFASTLVLIPSANVTSNTAPSVQWKRTYGGIGEEKICGWRSVVETSDSGYALVGTTTSLGAGNQDFWLVKTDVSGNVQWNKTYGRLYDDVAYSAIQTSDGGYALTGPSWNQTRGAHDLFLVKTDANGNMQWNLTYIPDSSGGSLDWGHPYSVIQTTDGGYILSGSVRHHPLHPTGDWDGWLVKTDANGKVEWDRPYGGGSDEGAHEVLQTSDGGYIFVGTTLSYGAGSGDAWLVKTDDKGNQQWFKTFGGSNWDDGWSISKTLDGGYIIGGVTRSFGAGNYDFWLIKTDANGNQQWAKTYGGINEDYSWSVVKTDDGGYALAGYTKSLGAGGSDFWIVKTDSSGNMEWNEIYGGTKDDQAYSIIQTSDRGYAVAGYTYSFGAGSSDFWLIKLAISVSITSFSISPNPFSPNGDGVKDTTTIKATFTTTVNWLLQIKNGAGKVTRSWTGTGTSLTITWDGKDKNGNIVLDGKYKCTISAGSATKTKTITVDTTPPTITGVADSPDPFNPKAGQTTTISYTLSEKCIVFIDIYDSAGNLMRTLSKTQLAGANSMIWDGKDRFGDIVPDGTYTYKIYVKDMAGNKATTYPAIGTVTVKST